MKSIISIFRKDPSYDIKKKKRTRIPRRVSKMDCSPLSATVTMLNGSPMANSPSFPIIGASEKLRLKQQIPQTQKDNLQKIALKIMNCCKEYEPAEKNIFFKEQPKQTFLDLLETLVLTTNKLLDEETHSNSIGVCLALAAAELLDRSSNIKLSKCSVHQYFLIAYILCYKFNEDQTVSNLFWVEPYASLSEIMDMEIDLFKALDWNCFVTDEHLETQKRKCFID